MIITKYHRTVYFPNVVWSRELEKDPESLDFYEDGTSSYISMGRGQFGNLIWNMTDILNVTKVGGHFSGYY